MTNNDTARVRAGGRIRELGAPLALIAAGALLLAHLVHPAFGVTAMVALFLLFVGGFGTVAEFAAWISVRREPAGASSQPAHGRLFGSGLALVAGALLLLHVWRPAYPIGAWIATYWPLLLILWGVIRLIEYAARGSASPRRRSGFSGGELLLLVILILAGLTFSRGYRSCRAHWGRIFVVQPIR